MKRIFLHSYFEVCNNTEEKNIPDRITYVREEPVPQMQPAVAEQPAPEKPPAPAEEAKQPIKIRGYANTITKDRSGDVIVREAWERQGALDNFIKNPIVLAFHDHTKPIGQVINYEVDDGGLVIEAEISPDIDDSIYKLIKSSILRTFSVGFVLKDAEYIPKDDTFFIKDLELMEISVVSVPDNPDSTFNVAKSISNEELSALKQKYTKSTEDSSSTKESEEILDMDKKELESLIASSIKAAETAKNEKARQEQEEQEKAAKAREEAKLAAEEIVGSLREESKKSSEAFVVKMGELQEQIRTHSEEIEKLLAKEKAPNIPAPNAANTAKTLEEYYRLHQREVDAAVLAAKALKKGLTETNAGKRLMEKAPGVFPNDSSGITVSSEDFEQLVSSSIIQEAEEKYVVRPLFGSIPMTSRTLITAINPEGASAGWVTPVPTPGSFGTTATTDPALTKVMQEVVFKTFKLAAKYRLTDETTEDAIISLAPIMREDLARGHARALDSAILMGDGTNDSPIGLETYATNASATHTPVGSSASVVTALGLAQARKVLGRWGIDKSELVFILSMNAYYTLLEDPEWGDVSQVADNSVKIRGEVGRIYGIPIVVSERIDALTTAVAGDTYGFLVNTTNFRVPVQREYMFQTEYDLETQTTLMVSTQRVGFNQLIPDEGVVAIKYEA